MLGYVGLEKSQGLPHVIAERTKRWYDGSFCSTEAGILSDLVQKAFMNFVVAVMAATTAVKGGVKLHTSIIRNSAVKGGVKLHEFHLHISDRVTCLDTEVLAHNGLQHATCPDLRGATLAIVEMRLLLLS